MCDAVVAVERWSDDHAVSDVPEQLAQQAGPQLQLRVSGGVVPLEEISGSCLVTCDLLADRAVELPAQHAGFHLLGRDLVVVHAPSGANSSGQFVIAFRTGNGRRLAEPADRRLLHREKPLVHLLARHRRAVVLELLREVVERAVADPARRALLARLLGEEAHRLREQAKWRVRHGEDLHGGRARARSVLTQAIPRERRIERGRRKDPARGAAGTTAPTSSVNPPAYSSTSSRVVTPFGAS